MRLTNLLLDTTLATLISSPHFIYSESRYFFEDIYYTGCRPIELLLTEKWVSKENKYILTTAKTNAKRTFANYELSKIFRSCVDNKIQAYHILTYDKVLLEFQRLFPLPAIYCGSKKVDLYLFRYNRARVMFNNSFSLQQIQDFFKWENEQTMHNYLLTPLSFEPMK